LFIRIQNTPKKMLRCMCTWCGVSGERVWSHYRSYSARKKWVSVVLRAVSLVILYIWKKKEARCASAVQVLTMYSSMSAPHALCMELLQNLGHRAFYGRYFAGNSVFNGLGFYHMCMCLCMYIRCVAVIFVW